MLNPFSSLSLSTYFHIRAVLDYESFTIKYFWQLAIKSETLNLIAYPGGYFPDSQTPIPYFISSKPNMGLSLNPIPPDARFTWTYM